MIRAAVIAPLALLVMAAAGDPARESSHVVAEGETLGGIANRAGVPAAAIAAANGLVEPYDVRAGQRLLIPRQRSHRVRAGETLLGIAHRNGVTLSQLAIANNLVEPYRVRPGQTLIIPAVLPASARAATAVAAAAAVADAPAAPRRPYFRRPHDGTVRLGYTSRADGGGHDGVDYAVHTGDMVRAAAGGTVVSAGAVPGRYGRVVAIDHGQGWTSFYGHLARVTVSQGEIVRAGERIGLAGQAGEAERPQLHFEIRRNQQPVDPAPLLGRR